MNINKKKIGILSFLIAIALLTTILYFNESETLKEEPKGILVQEQIEGSYI